MRAATCILVLVATAALAAGQLAEDGQAPPPGLPDIPIPPEPTPDPGPVVEVGTAVTWSATVGSATKAPPSSADVAPPSAPLPGASGADQAFDRTFPPPSPRPPLVGAAAARSSAPSGRASGTSGLTFADSRFVGYEALGRAAGKLNMCFAKGDDGACDGWWMCSASLIGRSLLVTAAHCVHKFGRKADGWPASVDGKLQLYWQPGLVNGTAPYGEWWAEDVMIGSPYFNGTDTCDSYGPGVSCNNDLALIWLKPGGNGPSPQPAGDALGTHFRYGWNGYGFTTPSLADQPVFGDIPSVAITQLGYPGWADRGKTMQISNSPAHRFFTNATTTGAVLKQMLRGTAMTGGSSGGPWLVNYGLDAAGVRYGSFADRNVVVGVTSWGWSDPSVKAQGVSYFGENAEFPGGAYGADDATGFPGYGAGNIGHLVWQAAEGPWGLKAKGLY